MDATAALDGMRNLSEGHTRRKLEITRHPTTRSVEDNDDADLESPISDRFYKADGNEGIRKTCNFTSREFTTLYGHLGKHIVSNWNVVRGRKSPHKPRDFFFMTLTAMKHGGAWDFLGKMFRINEPTFERLIVNFMKVITPEVTKRYVDPVSGIYSLTHIVDNKKRFNHMAWSVEAVEVTFQQTNRPSGNMQEGKVYFSGKHKLYRYKMEAAVRACGLASAFSTHYPGSVSDITILSERIDKHRLKLKKPDADKDFEDEYYMHEEYPNHWGVLLDKVYEGAEEMLRCARSYKKPPQGVLTEDKETYNKNLSSQRIIVENFFGRMVSLWNVMSSKCTWSEKLYDTIYELAVGFTNFHIDMRPLRANDGDWHNRYVNRLKSIGD